MTSPARHKTATTDTETRNFVPPPGKIKARLSVTNLRMGGLGLEAREGRLSKKWVYRYRIAGQSREMYLGSYPTMTLVDARRVHKDAWNLVELGIDPRKEKKATKASNEVAWTMNDAFDSWLEAYSEDENPKTGKRTPRTVRKQQGRWALHLSPTLGDQYVKSITPLELETTLKKAARSGREEARQCLFILKMLLAHCVKHGQVADNPAANISAADINAKPPESRSRALPLVELHELWAILNTQNESGRQLMSTPVANALKLLILTGARRSEVAGMKWSEIKGTTWTIPKERAKTRKAHRVHLSQQALAVLRQQKEINESKRSFVFESPQNQGPEIKPLNPDSITTAIARLQGRERSQHNASAPLYHLDHFHVHDLRRSAATGWTELLHADPLLADRMIAHKPPKLVGTYNLSERYELQCETWERWGELMDREATESEWEDLLS